jgi:endonuclease/exonuclease/phosphatase family metal-dependent hydrolase
MAEAVSFPFAVTTAESAGNRSDRFKSWSAYGVNESHWLYKGLVTEPTPADYLFKEEGTLSLEEADRPNSSMILSWTQRIPVIAKQIWDADPDLVFLEEVELGTLQDFANHLRASIHVLPHSRETKSFMVQPEVAKGEKKRGRPAYMGLFTPRGDDLFKDGCAILWKSATIATRESENGRLGQVLHYSDGQKLALLQPLYIKNERVLESNRNFLAVTTHLHYDPKSPKQGQEVDELLNWVNEWTRGSEMQRPVFFGADLNFAPQNANYQKFREAGFTDLNETVPVSSRKRFTTHVTRSTPGRSKLLDARKYQDESYTKDNPVLSDYIMVRDTPSSEVSVVKVGLTSYLDFDPSATNGLPNVHHSASDHFPVAYNLTLPTTA